MPLGPSPLELKTCLEPGCERPSIARGMCSGHYQKKWRDNALPVRESANSPALVSFVSRFRPEDFTRLRKLSRVSGRTLAELVRDAVTEYVKKFSATE